MEGSTIERPIPSWHGGIDERFRHRYDRCGCVLCKVLRSKEQSQHFISGWRHSIMQGCNTHQHSTFITHQRLRDHGSRYE
jgi:hypothetical protein